MSRVIVAAQENCDEYPKLSGDTAKLLLEQNCEYV